MVHLLPDSPCLARETGMRGTCTTLHCRQAAAERVSGEHGHLDLLFNVAGILHAPDGLAPGEED